MRIAIKAAYIGRDFFGSQRQADKRTVEGELLKALERCARIENFQSAGRTDRGVSALGMVFALDCESQNQPKTSAKPPPNPNPPGARHLPELNRPPAKHSLNLSQLNHHLPPDMCCYARAEVPEKFNPRFAKERHYRYFLPQGTAHPGKMQAAKSLDLELMRAAAKLLEGTHDFSNFCRKSERSPVRTITKIKVSRTRIDFFAESFLWEQARRMAYFIVQGGRAGKGIAIPAAGTPAKDPFLPGNPVPPLPPENLLLMDIKYPKVKFEANQRILSGFKSRMGALAEEKRVEQLIFKSFLGGL